MTDKAVTSETLMDIPKVNAPAFDEEKFEAQQAKHARQQARYTALNHAVQLEAARNLTEDPEDITSRILTRADAFYTYIQTDKDD